MDLCEFLLVVTVSAVSTAIFWVFYFQKKYTEMFSDYKAKRNKIFNDIWVDKKKDNENGK